MSSDGLPQAPCPSANLTTYTTPSSNPYVIYCTIDFLNSDLPAISAPTLLDCVTACDDYNTARNATVENGAACIAISWGNPAYSNPNCYLKYMISDGSVEYNAGLYSARRVGYEIGASLVLGDPATLGADPSTVLPTMTATVATGGSAPTTLATTSAVVSVSPVGATTSVAATSPTSLISLSTPAPAPPASSSSVQNTPSSSGLPTAAVVGIGVGVGVVAILLLAILVLQLRRWRNDKRLRGPSQHPVELGCNRGLRHEMKGFEAPELTGDEYSAELDGKLVSDRNS